MIIKFFGLIVLICTLSAVYLFETSSAATGAFRIFHWPAIVLTGIGPFGLLFVSSDWQRLKATLRFLFFHSAGRAIRVQESEAEFLHSLGQRYYVHGSKVLEESNGRKFSPYLQRAFRRLTVKMPVIDVRHMMERERERTEEQLLQSINLLNLGVRMSPSIGMLGTILGMVQLLSSLKDPSNIGSHMSLALLTTFYGLFFSLVFWTPLQQHVQALLSAELRGYDRVINWLSLLEERKPVQYFAEENALNQKGERP